MMMQKKKKEENQLNPICKEAAKISIDQANGNSTQVLKNLLFNTDFAPQ